MRATGDKGIQDLKKGFQKILALLQEAGIGFTGDKKLFLGPERYFSLDNAKGLLLNSCN